MAKVDDLFNPKDLEVLKQLIKLVPELAGEVTKLMNASKGLSDQVNETGKSEEKSKEKKKQLTEIEKERIRISKQTEKTIAKLALAETEAAKALAGHKVELEATTKAVKDNA